MTDEGWTVDTLRLHLERQHADLIALLNERHAAQTKAMETALAAAEKAVSKAEVANEKRFESVNEFRGQLVDQSNTFLTRHEYDGKHEALGSRLGRLEQKLEQIEGRSAGVRLSAGALVGGLSALGALVTIVVIVATYATR